MLLKFKLVIETYFIIESSLKRVKISFGNLEIHSVMPEICSIDPEIYSGITEKRLIDQEIDSGIPEICSIDPEIYSA
jgi:hypothetical protein